jgi:hypothetical protein
MSAVAFVLIALTCLLSDVLASQSPEAVSNLLEQGLQRRGWPLRASFRPRECKHNNGSP